MDVEPASSGDRPFQESGKPLGKSGRHGPAPERTSSDPAVAALLDAALQNAPADHGLEGEDRAANVPSPPGSSTGSNEPVQDARDALQTTITVQSPSENAGQFGPDHPQFQAILRSSVLEQVKAHADESLDAEVCGVLIGTVYENPQDAFIYVDGMIRGENTTSRSTAVTFTAETWQHIHKVMEEQHPGKQILAWYHTHPGFGIFLSEMDLFIQRHFFSAPWQMAFVVDPKSRESGMFAWRQAEVRRIEYVVDDEKSGKTPEEAFPSLPDLSTPAAFAESPSRSSNPAAVEDLVERIDVLETRMKWLTAGFAILAAVAIIWPFLVPLMLPKTGDAGPVSPSAAPTVPAEGQGGNRGDAPLVLPLPSD